MPALVTTGRRYGMRDLAKETKRKERQHNARMQRNSEKCGYMAEILQLRKQISARDAKIRNLRQEIKRLKAKRKR